ncbi:transporter substrate-binding domain-containing protein [Pelomonas sp. SE-A7]|uniref:substrate-binding periplasmic protein n=1 Tax=Pelomonas sp. SE-A7 TaxID=3054953 RepID=UPI00259CB642|nr:transporter substrate-binding domain-containing protein [Pelomonas sp. SE-A7]MDM4765034.1 transporter substrate-binding domain-containing protein [Pelomonas sp. SE-A7]
MTRMLGRFLLPLMLWLPGQAALAGPQTLSLASDDWCPFICARGRELGGGLLVEAVQRALPEVVLKPRLMPLNRAMVDTLAGRIDGIYAPALDHRLRLSQPVLRSRACFYQLAGKTWRYAGLESLKDRRLAAIADYGYDGADFDRWLGRADRAQLDLSYGENAGRNMLAKLQRGRVDLIVEHQAVLRHLSRELGLPAEQLREAGCLEQTLPLVIGFARDRPDSKRWVERLDRGMAELRASGELARLAQRYGLTP